MSVYTKTDGQSNHWTAERSKLPSCCTEYNGEKVNYRVPYHSLFIGVKIVAPEKAYNSRQTVGLLLLEKSTLCPGMFRSPRPVPEMPNSSPLTLASTAQRLNSDQHVRIPHPNRPTLLSPRRPNVTEVEFRVVLLFFPAAFLNGQTNSYSGSHGVTPEVCVSVWFFSLSICITLQFVPRPAAFLGPAVPDGQTEVFFSFTSARLGGVHDDDDTPAHFTCRPWPGHSSATLSERRGGPQWNQHYLQIQTGAFYYDCGD